MADLLAFLRDRIAEDEAAARAADVKQGDPEWRMNPIMAVPGTYRVRSALSHRPIALVEDVDGDPSDQGGGGRAILDGAAAAIHIARWDPARVLAEVAAKRAILDMLDAAVWRDAQPMLLRALAQPYAAHPEFDPAWKVTYG